MLQHFTHPEPRSSRPLGLSYHPTDSGTEEVTKIQTSVTTVRTIKSAGSLCSSATVQLFSETLSKPLSRPRKKQNKTKQKRLSFLKNTADSRHLSTKGRRIFVGCFTGTWPTLTLSWNSLFPLIAVPSVFLIKSHILFLRNMGASNKVQIKTQRASAPCRYTLFQNYSWASGPTAELWCGKSQAFFPPILMITHLLKPQSQEGFVFPNKIPKPYVCLLRIHRESQILKHSRGLFHSSVRIFPPPFQKFTPDPFLSASGRLKGGRVKCGNTEPVWDKNSKKSLLHNHLLHFLIRIYLVEWTPDPRQLLNSRITSSRTDVSGQHRCSWAWETAWQHRWE